MKNVRESITKRAVGGALAATVGISAVSYIGYEGIRWSISYCDDASRIGKDSSQLLHAAVNCVIVSDDFSGAEKNISDIHNPALRSKASYVLDLAEGAEALWIATNDKNYTRASHFAIKFVMNPAIRTETFDGLKAALSESDPADNDQMADLYDRRGVGEINFDRLAG